MKYVYTLYVVLIFVITFIIQLPFFLLFILFPKKKSGWWIHKLLRIWSKVFFFFAAIVLRVQGLEHIQKGQRYVVVANHQSFLDTPMIYVTLPFFVKPLARSDYGKIPIFGFIYRYCTIPVDRSSLASKKESFRRMLQAIRHEKQDIFVFPEGSFNETELILKPFYDGAFKIAKESGADLLPIVFPDTAKRWSHKGFFEWSPGICRAIILPPLTASEIEKMDIAAIKEQTFQSMQLALVTAAD